VLSLWRGDGGRVTWNDKGAHNRVIEHPVVDIRIIEGNQQPTEFESVKGMSARSKSAKDCGSGGVLSRDNGSHSDAFRSVRVRVRVG
jgi:hypothetical protein